MRNTAIGLGDRTLWPLAGTAPPDQRHRQWIDLGTLRLPRERIAGCRVDDIVDRDTAGRLASIGLLVAASLVLTLGLVDLDWRMRVMLGTAVVAIVAVVSAIEVLGIGRSVHYRLDVQLVDGRRISYTTADRREAERLADDLGPLPPPLIEQLD